MAASVAYEDITFRQAEIIKTQWLTLLSCFVCGKSRETRDTLAKESRNLRSLLDCINYRQSIRGASVNLALKPLNHFVDPLEVPSSIDPADCHV